MIEFMVIGAPRSGTAWAANWLTTDHTLCLHDPLWRMHYTDLDQIKSPKVLGVACTGLALFEKWTNAHSARKVILHRPLAEVNTSLEQIGMPLLTEEFHEKLQALDGWHMPWTDIFERPKAIYEFLLGRPFDQERHQALRELEVQMRFEGIHVDQAATARLLAELQRAAHGGAIQ